MTQLTITDFLAAYYVLAVMAIMIALHVRRMYQERAARGTITTVKKLVLVAFVVEFCSGFTYLIFAANWLPAVLPWWDPTSGNIIALNTVTIGFTVSTGLVLVFYLFHFERLMYTPLYAVAAMILFFFVSGHSDLYPYYVYIGATCALVFLFIASFRLRDNYALGLGFFYLLDFIENIFKMIGFDGNSPIVFVAEICTYAFGIFYATGFFKPFKQAASREQDVVESASIAKVE
ncbi:MAG TPA: hypothetical protein VKM55_26015 [Candidatus Lokiarchaeia archaeon]|nr:hypothetical protein [Candidatus Lokiarchaeia archaeon]